VGELQTMIDRVQTRGVTEAAMAGGIARAALGESFAADRGRSRCSPWAF